MQLSQICNAPEGLWGEIGWDRVLLLLMLILLFLFFLVAVVVVLLLLMLLLCYCFVIVRERKRKREKEREREKEKNVGGNPCITALAKERKKFLECPIEDCVYAGWGLLHSDG